MKAKKQIKCSLCEKKYDFLYCYFSRKNFEIHCINCIYKLLGNSVKKLDLVMSLYLPYDLGTTIFNKKL